MKPVILLAALLASSCTSKTEPLDRDAPLPAANLLGNLEGHMRNCPSGVSGSQTRAIRTRNGVDLAITSDNPVAQRAITAATEKQITMREHRWFLPPHTGMHGGPGTIGHCPVIHANTWISYDTIARGVLIHVVARDPNQVQQLQMATVLRVEALEFPSI